MTPEELHQRLLDPRAYPSSPGTIVAACSSFALTKEWFYLSSSVESRTMPMTIQGTIATNRQM